MLVPIVIVPVYLPAMLLLIVWIGFQVYTAFYGGGGTIAWWAHVGGFVVGAMLIVPLRHNSLPLFGGADNLPGGLKLRQRDSRDTGNGGSGAGDPWS